MVTGLGFGDMNLAFWEGIPCCLMTMAPPPTHTHTHRRARHEGQIGQRGYARFREVHHTTILTYTMTHSFPSLLIPSPSLLPCRVPALTPCEPLLLSCLSRPLALPLQCLSYFFAMASSP